VAAGHAEKSTLGKSNIIYRPDMEYREIKYGIPRNKKGG
jgi:hypothetical protein